MKKFALLLLFGLYTGFGAWAQQRTKITDDVYLVRYGNVTVIEDNKNQKTWSITIEREKKDIGEWVYYVACENKYTKAVAKTALSSAIAAAVSSTGIGAFGTSVAVSVSNVIYDDVCDYFNDK